MARSLERQLELALESVYIDVVLLREGRPLGPVTDRLVFMARNANEAVEIQKRIEKRDRKTPA